MTIRGLDSLMRKLDSIGGNSRRALRVGIHKGVKYVQGEAKLLCPVGDSGRLRNSIEGEVEERQGAIVGRISTNVEYAPYVEFGTGQRGEASPSPPKSDKDLNYRQDWVGMDAQPFLYPAIKQNEDTVRKMAADELRKEIRRVAGNG